MLRSALGAFDAIVGRNAVLQRFARDAVAMQARKVPAAGTFRAVPWQRRITSLPLKAVKTEKPGGAWRFGRLRSPLTTPKRPFHSSKARKSQASEGNQNPTPEKVGLRARLSKLSREYGWAAVGVYIGLTVLDLPFCFLLVRMVGTERISEAEHYVVSHVQRVIPERVKTFWHEYRKALKEAEKEQLGNNDISEDVEMVGWGVKEAEERNKSDASLATQLALAYAIHKTFIFVRVPLTAAITPKVVGILRSWGWQIGKKRVKR